MRTTELSQHLIDELSPLLGAGESASVARLVLEDLFGWRRGQRPRLLSQDEEILAWTAINRLQAGEPVQYVTGIADFYGLQLRVSPAVLIPRPETEELVEWILATHGTERPLRVLDVGTGSGCIPLALKARRPTWSCTGLDVSPAALEIARENARTHDLDVDFGAADILQPLPAAWSGPFDVLVSNPPYIPPSERDRMSASTLAHEPETALFVPEGDPLLFYRRLLEIAPRVLRPEGRVYVETNEFNHEAVTELFSAHLPAATVERRRDLQEKWRMVRGALAAPGAPRPG